MAVKTSTYFSKQCNGIEVHARKRKKEKRKKKKKQDEERRRRGRPVSLGWSYTLTFPLEEISRRLRGGPRLLY